MPRKPKTKPKIRSQAKLKPTRKTVPKASAPVRRRAAKPDAVDRLIEAGATALALPLDPAWRDNVALNVRLILSHAARVEEFALPDDAEPAPVFHA
jgi:Protein of unknown function (DUF4089)